MNHKELIQLVKLAAASEPAPHPRKYTMANPWAAFAMSNLEDGSWAGTTRDNLGTIGLPGGKLDPGESARDAVIREAMEEGWDIDGVEDDPFMSLRIGDDKVVSWFRAQQAKEREEFKEKGRINPVRLSAEELRNSGNDNDVALRMLEKYLSKG
jgi:hypothetical protein